jgi:hypothetical protein
MVDADNRIIPLVDDDQGEGIKNFIEEKEELLRKLAAQETLEKSKTESEMLEEILQRLESLERFIRQAIGNHFLLNGKWQEMEKL